MRNALMVLLYIVLSGPALAVDADTLTVAGIVGTLANSSEQPMRGRVVPMGLRRGSMWQAQHFMRRIGSVLRVENHDFTREPLPERWVDLIRFLNEKERKERDTEPAR